MRSKVLVIVSIILVTSSCDVLNQMGDVKRFAQCHFSIYSVNVNKLGGIDLQGYDQAGDLNLVQLMTLGQKLVSGSINADMTVTVVANNNETKKAAISGVDWQLFMKDKQYSSGKVDQYIEVLPGQSTSFNLDVTFDILKILKSEKINSILDIVLNGDDSYGLNELDISLKVKPYYSSNGKLHEYPGYITIRP